MTNPAKHFVYQRIHALQGKVLHLADHLTIGVRAYEQIYGIRPGVDEKTLAAHIAEALRMRHSPVRTGTTMMLYFYEAGDGNHTLSVEYERQLLDAGYALSALRPKAATCEYSIPFGGFPTNFQIEAQALFDTLVFRQHGATRSVRREGDRLLSCGDAALFAIRGRVLFTAPLMDGAVDSVERRLVFDAAAKSRLSVREEPVLHSELKNFDELFFADAAGITSLAECDGAKFMSIVTARLAGELKVEN